MPLAFDGREHGGMLVGREVALVGATSCRIRGLRLMEKDGRDRGPNQPGAGEYKKG
jgi:hypothetical protein